MLIAVIEMSLSRWLVAGIVPGIERWPPLSRDKQTLCDVGWPMSCRGHIPDQTRFFRL
jgi:hypothetical protein